LQSRLDQWWNLIPSLRIPLFHQHSLKQSPPAYTVTLQQIQNLWMTIIAIRAGHHTMNPLIQNPFLEGGPAISIPEKQTHYINIHAYYTARYDKSIRGIKLYRRPADIWEAKRGNAHTLKHYLCAINPLTQLTQKYFQYLLPEFYTKDKKVYDQLPVTYLTDNEKEWFGIWTSRETVLYTFTDVHVDLQDLPLGFCAIMPLGNFTDDHICLPSLGIKLALQPSRFFLYKSFYNYIKINIFIRYYCLSTLAPIAPLCW